MKRSTFLKTLAKSAAVLTVAPVVVAKAVEDKSTLMVCKYDGGKLSPFVVDEVGLTQQYYYVKGIDEDEARFKYGTEMAKKLFKSFNK